MADTTDTRGTSTFPSADEIRDQMEDALEAQRQGKVRQGDLSRCDLCGKPVVECDAAGGHADDETSGGDESSEDNHEGDGSGESSSDPKAKYPERLDSTGDGTPDDHGNIAPPPTIAAWIARVLTVGTMALIIGYLVYLCFRPEVLARFDIELAFDQLDERNGRYVLPVMVTNDSTESMSGVAVEVVLSTPEGETVRSFEIALMGEGESANAEVTFRERPTPDSVEADVVSYVSP